MSVSTTVSPIEPPTGMRFVVTAGSRAPHVIARGADATECGLPVLAVYMFADNIYLDDFTCDICRRRIVAALADRRSREGAEISS